MAQQTRSRKSAGQSAAAKLSSLLRRVGRDRPATRIMNSAARSAKIGAAVAVVPVSAEAEAEADDYTQIDPTLATQATPFLNRPPQPGVGYRGFTPVQRHHFLQWAEQPEGAAPPAFQQLYLAQLEVSLFDTAAKAIAAHNALCYLADAPAWQQNERLWRALLLSYWLQQENTALSHFLTTLPALSAELTGTALGLLARLDGELTVDHLPLLAERWQLPPLPDPAVLRLRLDFLRATVGQDLLAHALAALEPAALAPQRWRTVHRQVRIQMVQPNLRGPLRPLLQELATGATASSALQATAGEEMTVTVDSEPTESEAAGESGEKWQLVLEFGDSRSEFFALVVQHARRQDNYLQILDEDRRMIHRITFAKRELRRFWFLWEYVQNWSTTQVFVNGKALQKWEIYPYSPYLR